jgi:hypothetical protein
MSLGKRVKKYNENNERADRKRIKRQRKGKEKRQNDQTRALFYKVMGKLGKNADNRKHNIIFFTQSEYKNPTGGKYRIFFSPPSRAVYWGENKAVGGSRDR